MDEAVFEDAEKIGRILREAKEGTRLLEDLSLGKREPSKGKVSPFFKELLFLQPLIAAGEPREFEYKGTGDTGSEEANILAACMLPMRTGRRLSFEKTHRCSGTDWWTFSRTKR